MPAEAVDAACLWPLIDSRPKLNGWPTPYRFVQGHSVMFTQWQNHLSTCFSEEINVSHTWVSWVSWRLLGLPELSTTVRLGDNEDVEGTCSSKLCKDIPRPFFFEELLAAGLVWGESKMGPMWPAPWELLLPSHHWLEVQWHMFMVYDNLGMHYFWQIFFR
jgi:hypothetical protein